MILEDTKTETNSTSITRQEGSASQPLQQTPFSPLMMDQLFQKITGQGISKSNNNILIQNSQNIKKTVNNNEQIGTQNRAIRHPGNIKIVEREWHQEGVKQFTLGEDEEAGDSGSVAGQFLKLHRQEMYLRMSTLEDRMKELEGRLEANDEKRELGERLLDLRIKRDENQLLQKIQNSVMEQVEQFVNVVVVGDKQDQGDMLVEVLRKIEDTERHARQLEENMIAQLKEQQDNYHKYVQQIKKEIVKELEEQMRDQNLNDCKRIIGRDIQDIRAQILSFSERLTSYVKKQTEIESKQAYHSDFQLNEFKDIKKTIMKLQDNFSGEIQDTVKALEDDMLTVIKQLNTISQSQFKANTIEEETQKLKLQLKQIIQMLNIDKFKLHQQEKHQYNSQYFHNDSQYIQANKEL